MLTARMTNETDLVLGNMLDLTAGDVLLKVSDELNITQAGALTMLTESWRIGTSNLTMAGDHVRATVDGECIIPVPSYLPPTVYKLHTS